MKDSSRDLKSDPTSLNKLNRAALEVTGQVDIVITCKLKGRKFLKDVREEERKEVSKEERERF